MSEKKVLRSIHEAQDAIVKAQAAIEKAQDGLTSAESDAETAKARRRPVARTLMILAVGVAAALVFIGYNKSDRD
jgi:hypothetical protein